jgi:indole-3-glycerol phosphate synthase
MTRDEVAARKHATPRSALRERPLWHEPRRGFRAALAGRPAPAVIAEIKRASPSRGVIRSDFDPPAHARSYESAGATALSVLTDERFFQGHLDHLATVRGVVGLPCLRKGLPRRPYQVDEARAYGADAILVIAAAGSRDAPDGAALRRRARRARRALVEVHDEREPEWAAAAGATLVGVNNRDLSTFVTSLETTERLAPLRPAGALPRRAESGLHSSADVRRRSPPGAGRADRRRRSWPRPDPGAALAEFLR